MAADSQSGFNAPRAHLAGLLRAPGQALYGEVRGPLGSPMKALEALKADDVDVIALDSFFLDLCRHHEPGRLEGVACVATTAWTPIPLLVAAADVDAAVVGRLRDHLLAVHRQPGYRPLLADVLLERFVAPDASAYRDLERLESFAMERGYAAIR
jgi:ABC-type phosphate/phosphonate transport system substrate-binding protein